MSTLFKKGGTMKTKLFIAAVMFISLCFISLNAQSNQMGLLAGINISNLDEKNANYDNRTEYAFGGILEFSRNEMFSICLEPMYLQKGASEEISILGINFEMDWRINYLEVPVMLKYKMGQNPTKFYFIFGPTFGILLSSEMEVSALGESIEVDVKDIMESIDFGVSFGGGLSFPMGVNSTIFIDIRYTLGLADIIKGGTIESAGETESIPDTEVKTNGILITAGFLFPMGQKQE